MSHLSQEQIVRAIDDELPPAERAAVEDHLMCCEQCRLQYRELGALSLHIEGAVERTPVAMAWEARWKLDAELRSRETGAGRGNGKARRAWWPVGIVAAAALLAVIFMPHMVWLPAASPSASAALEAGAVAPSTFELDGETFVALPYSNPELPVSSSRIVQMEVPVSSLQDAGVLAAPLSDQTGDRSVLADVLLGADGQPRGVHVLSEL